MKSKFLCFIIAISVLFATIIPSVAQAYTEEGKHGILSYYIMDNQVTITYCDPATSVEIPSQIKGYPVVSIESYVFSSRNDVESVIIPNSVKTICSYAFTDNTALKEITIPDGVTVIESYTFSGCTSLKTVKLSDNIERIEVFAFDDCSSLKSINIPASTTEIKEDFLGCTSLESINVDSANTVYSSVDGVLFSKDKTELLMFPDGKEADNYIIPDTTTRIFPRAFDNCIIKGITIPDTLRSVMNDLDECYYLENIYVSDNHKRYCSVDGVLFDRDKTEIEQYPIGRKATEYIIPDSVEYLPPACFAYNKYLKKVSIPENVTDISHRMFEDCTALEKVIIYSKTAEFADDVFEGCEDFEIHGYADSTAELYAFENGYRFVFLEDTVSAGSVELTINSKKKIITPPSPSGGTLIISIYEGSGKLIDTLTETITESNPKLDYVIGIGDYAKVLWVKSLTSFSPVCNFVTFEL